MKKYEEKTVALPHAPIKINIVFCDTIIEKQIYDIVIIYRFSQG